MVGKLKLKRRNYLGSVSISMLNKICAARMAWTVSFGMTRGSAVPCTARARHGTAPCHSEGNRPRITSPRSVLPELLDALHDDGRQQVVGEVDQVVEGGHLGAVLSLAGSEGGGDALAVGLAHLAVGAAIGVVVEGQRLSAAVGRAGEGVGVAVPREVGGGEDGHAVEVRGDAGHAFAHVLFPEFEVAAPGFVPVLVEIHEHVHPAVEAHELVLVEVHMYLEVAAGLYLVAAAALKVRVGHERLFDAREVLEELQEGLRVEEVHELLGERPELVLALGGVLDLVGIGVEDLVLAGLA